MILWFPLVFPLYILRFKLGPFPTTALEIAFVALALFVTWNNGWGVWREGIAKTKPWHLPAALWILATLIAIFVAPNHIAALGLWRAYVLEPMLYAVLLAGTLKRDEGRATLITALIGAVMFIAAIATLQYLGILSIPHPWDTDFLTRRATGPFPFPNAIALFCAPIAALCIGRLVADNKQHALLPSASLLWLGYLCGTLATILAKSIGGFLAILIATLVACVWNNKTRRGTMMLSALIVIGIAATPTIRMPIVSALTFKTWSGTVRLIIWKEAVQMLKDRPILGAGFGAYPEKIKPYRTATFIEIFQYPHNLLLNVWSEAGILGLVAFGWICATWIKKIRNVDKTSSIYMTLPLIAILVHGLVDVPYFKNDLAFLFWTLASIHTTPAS